MRRSGVVEARYNLDSRTVYEAEPLMFDASGIHFELREYSLSARRDELWPTVADARQAVEVVLRSWRLEQQLTQGFADFDFRFSGTTVVGAVADSADHSVELLRCERDDKGPLVISWRHYPRPPQILVTEELEVAADRLARARLEFGESLETAAYFALTLAERLAGDRKAAAARFGVNREVLQRIGMLSSTRGTLRTARKALGGSLLPLSTVERRWLHAAVRVLLLHIGLVNAGLHPPRIDLSHLPPLAAV